MKIVREKIYLFHSYFLIKAGEVWVGKVGEAKEMAVEGVSQVPPQILIALTVLIPHSA